MLIRDLDEMFEKICKEFRACNFEEDKEVENKVAYIKDGNVATVTKHDDCVQIYTSFSHDWNSFVFPFICVMTVCGNSLFYYGRIENVFEKID